MLSLISKKCTPYVFGLKFRIHHDSIFSRIEVFKFLLIHSDTDQSVIETHCWHFRCTRHFSFTSRMFTSNTRIPSYNQAPPLPVHHAFPLPTEVNQINGRLLLALKVLWGYPRLQFNSEKMGGHSRDALWTSPDLSYFLIGWFHIWIMMQWCFQTNQACVYHGSRVQITITTDFLRETFTTF